MDDIKDFISNILSGNNVEAKENFAELISSRAMDALAERKQEIAQSLFQTEDSKNIPFEPDVAGKQTQDVKSSDTARIRTVITPGQSKPKNYIIMPGEKVVDTNVKEGAIGTALGAAGGALVGGPIGAAIGGYAGNKVGNAIPGAAKAVGRTAKRVAGKVIKKTAGIGAGAAVGGALGGPVGAALGGYAGHRMTKEDFENLDENK